MGVEYKRIDAGASSACTAEYRALNPNGLVPTLDDDGFVLWESNAIVRYLSARHGVGTCGRAIRGRARWRTNGWIGRSRCFGRRSGPMFMGSCGPRRAERDQSAIESSRLKTAEVLGMVDARLASRPISPATLTMGDIPLGAGIWRWMALPIERPPPAERAALV
jgi:glutathione S-transferase